MPNKKLFAVLTTGAFLAVAGCSSSGGDSASETVGYLSPVLAQEGQQQTVLGIENAAAELGWGTTVLDSNRSPDTQVSNMQTLLSQNPDGIGTYTLDPGATAGVYAQAEQAGIPIVGINSEGAGVKTALLYENYACEPGGWFDKIAEKVAGWRPGGKVAVIAYDGIEGLTKLIDCETDALEAQGLEIVQTVSNASDDQAGGAAVMADVLTRNPDVDVVVSYNDPSALGASTAITASGRTVSPDGTGPGVVVVGAGDSLAGIDALKQGRLTITGDIGQVEMGWLVIDTLNKIKEGDAPERIVLAGTVLDSSNVSEWVAPDEREITFDSIPIASSR